MNTNRVHSLRKRAAKQRRQLRHREVEKRILTFRFQFLRQPSAEIDLDLRPTERPQMIRRGGGSIDGAEPIRIGASGARE